MFLKLMDPGFDGMFWPGEGVCDLNCVGHQRMSMTGSERFEELSADLRWL